MIKTEDIYLYNYSFFELINLIIWLLKNHIIPKNIKSLDYCPCLFDNIVNTKYENNENELNSFKKRINSNILSFCFNIFLSEDENKEIIIFYILIYYLKYKDQIFFMRNNEIISKALKISSYVKKEAHKLKGFLRFKELENNVLYAKYESTNNIIYFLSNHFKERLKNEYWIIEDTKRKILSVYNKEKFFIIKKDNFEIITNKLSDEENNIEDLWKSFYKTIENKTRRNEKCRMNFMPKKYWKYIIEMSDEYETNN